MNFNSFLGSSEASYSKVIAQTFILSGEFRKRLLEQMNRKHDNDIIKQMTKEDVLNVVLEKNFDGNGERIDIFFELQNGLMIGIENKKWAMLQPKQLIRYQEAFEKLNQNYILVFLAPKNYALPPSEKPRNLKKGVFIEIDYVELDEICRTIVLNTKEELETNYFVSLKNFIGDLIMQPLNLSEINSLINFSSADKKINQIMDDLEFEYGFEKNANYRLGYKIINGQVCYYGFRFGTQWYYKESLLNDQPELIFFIKDIEPDFSNATKSNEKISEFYKKHNVILKNQFLCEADYYQRKRANECRLVIRRSLADFENKDVSDVIQWFKGIEDFMKQNY